MNKDYFDELMPVAFAGMKGDMGFDRVESHPSAAEIPFGVVVGMNGDGRVEKGKATRAIGIALHSHAVTGNGYKQYEAVSVMTRGLAWALAKESDASAVGQPVKFGADGEIDSSAGDTLPNAMVRDVRMADGKRLVLVELHAPTV